MLFISSRANPKSPSSYTTSPSAIQPLVLFPVEFDNFGSLILDRVHIVGGALGSSIKFAPTGPARLMISNSIINKGGNVSNGTGAGLLVQPQPGGTAQVALDNVRIEGNVFGIAIDGSSSTGGINATIRNSTIAGNKQDGIVATTSSGHAPIGVFVANTGSINNAFGIHSIGPNATVRVSNTEIVGNGTGLATLSGGALLSAGNNHVQANGSNGSFSGSIPAQ
jgi:hypothetical protein